MANLEDQRLLLDTHVLLWMLIGSPRMRDSPQRAAIESAAERDALSASAISVWEITAMQHHGVLRFAMPLEQWLEQALDSPGLRMIAIDPQISFAAATLPGDFDGDFADRCIVATARTHNRLLVTADPRIHRYAAHGYLRTIGIGKAER